MIELNEQLLDHIENLSGCTLARNSYRRSLKRGKEDDSLCFSLDKGEDGWCVNTSYFIGVDWLDKGLSSVRVLPKFNDNNNEVEVNYLKLLEEALKEPKNIEHLEGLLHIDFDSPTIPIPRQEDALSLFLVSEYLHVLTQITKKGLRKSYYRIEENLKSKIKGKLLVGATIKKNLVKGSSSDNYCRHQEYGVDIPENRLLKQAMLVSAQILDTYSKGVDLSHLKGLLMTMHPAWKRVGTECDARTVNDGRGNAFFSEYPVAIRLAKLILRHASVNQVLHGVSMSATPPYWIDMSKLFELYIFKELRRVYDNEVIYHPHFRGLEPDYLLLGDDNHSAYVVDAKYKRYSERTVNVDDIRQVVGYSRMSGVRQLLGVNDRSIIPCVIVHPDLNAEYHLKDERHWKPISGYIDIFKTGITLPVISKT